jgi:hypothetical protein
LLILSFHFIFKEVKFWEWHHIVPWEYTETLYESTASTFRVEERVKQEDVKQALGRQVLHLDGFQAKQNGSEK